MSRTIQRNDYLPPSHKIDRIQLTLDIDKISTLVTSTLSVRPNPDYPFPVQDLRLNGEELRLVSVQVNGKELRPNQYECTRKHLTLRNITNRCTVTITNRICPEKNTALSGLYCSGEQIMSQCRAEGFRRITYYLDRPDVLALFNVTIRASKDLYPVLLSNGNRKYTRDLEDGRHEVHWEDPFPKPCYLFALVAGQLVCNSEKYRLGNGREVTLEVWVEEKDLNKTQHTMDSLKQAIAWDEKRFGLYLDLDLFMIVVTHDFNAGAMENKGLNIFNSRLALANPRVATDQDYFNIQSVVGHEYFHNWTGNRITVRDWFQLTLKEGLTVFRDQEFSADMLGNDTARVVQRINDVHRLRSMQYPEDASPMAHPIRPDSYQEINNFYTTTVYEKGAEVIRMLHTLLGEETFQKGFKDYIQTNDHKAVTCEAFLRAMERASGRNLQSFMRWYRQAGTPRISVSTHWNPTRQSYHVHVKQSLPNTGNQPAKEPLLIPFPFALLNAQGEEMPLQLLNESGEIVACNGNLELTEWSHDWTFVNVTQAPVPSFNRGFAAPIVLNYNYTQEELAFLALHETDGFNQYEAFHQLMLLETDHWIRLKCQGKELALTTTFSDTFAQLLQRKELAPAFKAKLLTFPATIRIANRMPLIDPHLAGQARQGILAAIVDAHEPLLNKCVAENISEEPYTLDSHQVGQRALKNILWGYLMAKANRAAVLEVRAQFLKHHNLTDDLAAMQLILDSRMQKKYDFLVDFLEMHKHEPLFINKWLELNALTKTRSTDLPVYQRIRELLKSSLISLKNPNNVYSLLLTFFMKNPEEFHRLDGEGYRLWYDIVITLDKINPQVAARVARALENWRRYTPRLAKLQYRQLDRLWQQHETLSTNVAEIINKTLHNPV